MKNRIYIFLDKSLPNQQRVVQAAHLSLEVVRLKGSPEIHPSIIVLGISKDDLANVREYLDKKHIGYIDFFEPLLSGVTGICTTPISSQEGKLLQHFPMLKVKDFLGEC